MFRNKDTTEGFCNSWTTWRGKGWERAADIVAIRCCKKHELSSAEPLTICSAKHKCRFCRCFRIGFLGELADLVVIDRCRHNAQPLDKPVKKHEKATYSNHRITLKNNLTTHFAANVINMSIRFYT